MNDIKPKTDSQDPLEREGYEAYFDGADLDDCPHDEGTDGQNAWRKGWKKADLEEEFELNGEM
jgi:ribosome modulation factor